MSKHSKLPHKTQGLANNAGAMAVLAFSNDEGTSTDEHGWTLIPFGLWPHALGLQRFGKDQARAIFNSWHTMMGEFKRTVVGYPVFKGHPDVPGLEKDFPDKTEYGQVADMEVRDNGLAIKTVLSNAGAELVRQGWKFISPYWKVKPVGKEGTVTAWEPADLNSIGLVKRPNIPNKSLANNSPMNPKLIALLKLAADSNDDAIFAAVQALANDASTATTALANAKSEAKTALENAVAAKTTAETALANERTARIADALENAVKHGRISIAEKATWEPRLKADFAKESVALANEKAKIKTDFTAEQETLAAATAKLAKMTPAQLKSLANDADDESGDAMANTRTMSALIANEMDSAECKSIKSPSARHAKAFQNVCKAHPELMKGSS